MLFFLAVTGLFTDSPVLAGEICPPAFYIAELVNARDAARSSLNLYSRDVTGWHQREFDKVVLYRPPLPRNSAVSSSPVYGYRLTTPFASGRFLVDFKASAATGTAPGDTLLVPSGRPGGLRATPREISQLLRSAGCKEGLVSELESTGSGADFAPQFFYLLNCPNMRKPGGGANPVTFLRDSLRISSDEFSYHMNRKNQMLFDRMEIVRNPQDRSPNAISYLENGAFDIRADIKKFFTMHFTSGNVESKVVAHREGLAGTQARLSFDLKLLFLRLDLQLLTDVMFLRDMAFLPMTMKIPAHAEDYVHPNTGVLYSWFTTKGTHVRSDWMHMPPRQRFSSQGELKARANEVAATHCEPSGQCSFRAAVGRTGTEPVVAMEINIRRELLLKGFYPQYVADASSEQDDLGWTWDGKQGDGQVRQGLYFELSSLPKGEHGFEIWLRILPPNASRGSVAFCPSRWNVRDIKVSTSN
ncbi:MAG: hypothetical protein RIQ81_1698 [Pseudomonadota bacterium]